ncbi:MAG: Myb-like DNA-binding domain-containing protein [Schleiferiaceae bacterium]
MKMMEPVNDDDLVKLWACASVFNLPPPRLHPDSDEFKLMARVLRENVLMKYELSKVRMTQNTSVESDSDSTDTAGSKPKIRRGAWSPDEHERFLEGVSNLGRGNWSRIASEFVKTRTATQVSSHAQKHFERLARIAPPKKK